MRTSVSDLELRKQIARNRMGAASEHVEIAKAAIAKARSDLAAVHGGKPEEAAKQVLAVITRLCDDAIEQLTECWDRGVAVSDKRSRGALEIEVREHHTCGDLP